MVDCSSRLQAAILGRMDISQNFAHLGYDLVCSVTAVDGGKFSAAVVASSKTWPHRPRVLHIHPQAFATEAEAFIAAQAHGIAWIQSYG